MRAVRNGGWHERADQISTFSAFQHFGIAWFYPPVRLTRVIWALLALALVVALAATWVLTRPVGPEPPWVGAVSVLAGDGRDGWQDGSADDARSPSRSVWPPRRTGASS